MGYAGDNLIEHAFAIPNRAAFWRQEKVFEKGEYSTSQCTYNRDSLIDQTI